MKIVDIAGNAELNLALRRDLGLSGYMISQYGLINTYYRNFFSDVLLHLNIGRIAIVKKNLREFDATFRLIRDAIRRWK